MGRLREPCCNVMPSQHATILLSKPWQAVAMQYDVTESELGSEQYIATLVTKILTCTLACAEEVMASVFVSERSTVTQ